MNRSAPAWRWTPLIAPLALLVAALSCLAALAAIALMMRWLRRSSFLPFVIYRVLLGIALLIWLNA